MTFSKKIFIAVFFTALVLGSLIIWTSHHYISMQTEEKFISRYSVFTTVLSGTLTQLDNNTEKLMLNAAHVLAEKDKAQGLLSTEHLKTIRNDLNVTHIFIVDKNGKFIRSTNEDPGLIPNAFSFCPAYKDMVVGNSDGEATPIIHPRPEPKPYKFLFVPSHDRQRLLEVGVRVDFIAKTLSEVLGSDENIDSMTLYDPHGTIFGRFNSKEIDFKTGTVKLPDSFPQVIDNGDSYHFFAKVTSSHPRCCQCDVSKTSKNGEYYYVLEANVSKKELRAVLASTNNIFLALGFGNLILALFLSRYLSRRLVRHIERAASKVRDIQANGDLKDRISLKSGDEVGYLTEEFDKLLEKLEVSQQQLIEAEKVQAKVQMAREVAHNIKSPVVALEMMLPTLITVPERIQRVLKNSVREIKNLTEKLKSQADSLSSPNTSSKDELLYLPTILDDLVSVKAHEYLEKKNVKITFANLSDNKTAFSKGNATELKSILSNLINNSIEASTGSDALVEVGLSNDNSACDITVRDNGAGIPKEYLDDLGKKVLSFKGGCERGLGLVHAYKVIQSWDGSISIDSEIGNGTIVRISLTKEYVVPTQKPQVLEARTL